MQGIENKGWGVKEILKPSQAEHFRLKSCFSLSKIYKDEVIRLNSLG